MRTPSAESDIPLATQTRQAGNEPFVPPDRLDSDPESGHSVNDQINVVGSFSADQLLCKVANRRQGPFSYLLFLMCPLGLDVGGIGAIGRVIGKISRM